MGIESEPLISVILPVFNTDAYLKRCIDSVINQNYTNLEILLVDDGSTDLSGDICDKFSNSPTYSYFQEMAVLCILL
jgi:glycosyltransferase involved in cell wall biosynthesis